MNVKDVAEFIERDRCVGCESSRLTTLDRGRFGDDPHRSMILNSPWGESPLPFIERASWELVECGDCAQVFHKRVLSDAWEQRRFERWMTADAIYRFEEAAGSTKPNAVFERARVDIEKLLVLEKLSRGIRGESALRVLDFGCGWGRFIGLASLFGMEAHGIDKSAPRLSGSKSRAKVFESWETYRDHVRERPHVIALFEVLEHLRQPLDVLRIAHRELVPSGLLVLEVPDCSGVKQIRTSSDLIVDGIDHINAFTPDTLTGIAARCGFEPVRVPTTQVSADVVRVIKREVKRAIGRFRKPTTQQVFRRVEARAEAARSR